MWVGVCFLALYVGAFLPTTCRRCLSTVNVSEWKTWGWGFVWIMLASSNRHVLDQCSCADGLHSLMQPSGQSDSEWRDVPCPDLCVRRKMERWVTTRDMMRESRRWGRGKNKTNINHGLGVGKKKDGGRRIRGWWRAEEALKDGGIWRVEMDVGCVLG